MHLTIRSANVQRETFTIEITYDCTKKIWNQKIKKIVHWFEHLSHRQNSILKHNHTLYKSKLNTRQRKNLAGHYEYELTIHLFRSVQLKNIYTHSSTRHAIKSPSSYSNTFLHTYLNRNRHAMVANRGERPYELTWPIVVWPLELENLKITRDQWCYCSLLIDSNCER